MCQVSANSLTLIWSVHTHTHTLSRAACVSRSSLWQRVLATRTLHCSLSSLTTWPSNTAFQWWLKVSTGIQWLLHTQTHWMGNWNGSVRMRPYYSVCGSDSSLRAVISLQLGPSLDTVRLLTERKSQTISGCLIWQFTVNIKRRRSQSWPYRRKLFSRRNLIFCSKLLSSLKTSMRTSEWKHTTEVSYIITHDLCPAGKLVTGGDISFNLKKEQNWI